MNNSQKRIIGNKLNFNLNKKTTNINKTISLKNVKNNKIALNPTVDGLTINNRLNNLKKNVISNQKNI